MGLESGRLLTAISWNIDFSSPDVPARTAAILEHLKEACKTPLSQTVIMFQEVCLASLNVILKSQWVQQHFNLSNVAPPKSVYTEISGDSFVMRRLSWRAGWYFTLMMISKDLPTLGGFRAPLITWQGRDALAVDIPVTESSGLRERQYVIRICTTHLESLYDGRPYRQDQLASISSLLRDDPKKDRTIVAGLVAGDMNAMDKSEHEYPKAEDVQLQDAWESGPEGVPLILKPFQRDLTNGLAKGCTWGYQRRNNKRQGKRMDKFLYTGALEYCPLISGEQLTRGMRRLGVDLKTEVDVYRREKTEITRTPSGKLVPKTSVEFRSVESIEQPRPDRPYLAKTAHEWVRTTTDAWLRDHYGILARFEVDEFLNEVLVRSPLKWAGLG